MNWYIVNKDYVEYLIQIDSKVGYIEYGSRLKLYIGILLEVNEQKYYVPISSFKEKHRHMSNSVDFHKIEDSETGQIYAVINLNNMIPVPDSQITMLKYDEIQKYRAFSNDKARVDYIYLLQKEKAIIDQISSVIDRKASQLYIKYKQNPKSKLSQRCCNFPELEKAAKGYSDEF